MNFTTSIGSAYVWVDLVSLQTKSKYRGIHTLWPYYEARFKSFVATTMHANWAQSYRMRPTAPQELIGCSVGKLWHMITYAVDLLCWLCWLLILVKLGRQNQFTATFDELMIWANLVTMAQHQGWRAAGLTVWPDWEKESYPEAKDLALMPLFALLFPTVRYFLDNCILEVSHFSFSTQNPFLVAQSGRDYAVFDGDKSLCMCHRSTLFGSISKLYA